MGRLVSRAFSIALNLQLVLAYVSIFPEAVNNKILSILVILDIIAILSIHYLITYFLAIVDYPIFKAIWDIISGTSIEKIFIVGVIVHIYLIQNNLLMNMV